MLSLIGIQHENARGPADEEAWLDPADDRMALAEAFEQEDGPEENPSKQDEEGGDKVPVTGKPGMTDHCARLKQNDELRERKRQGSKQRSYLGTAISFNRQSKLPGRSPRPSREKTSKVGGLSGHPRWDRLAL